MKTKQLLYMLGVLVVIVAIIIVSNKIISKAPKKDELLMFPKINVEQIASIEIKDRDSLAVIKKQGSDWVVQFCDNYKADTAKVNAALQVFSSLEKRELASTNKDKQKVFGIDSVTGRRVIVKDVNGKILVDFWIGDMNYELRSDYVRLNGSDEVYCCSKNIKNNFLNINEMWKDRKIWEFAKENISRIKTDHDTTNMALEKDSLGNWNLSKPAMMRADASKVDGFLDRLSRLETSTWAGINDKYIETAFKDSTIQINIEEKSGTGHNLTISKEKEGYCYTKIDQNPNIFKLSSYVYTDLKKVWKDFADTSKTDAALKTK